MSLGASSLIGMVSALLPGVREFRTPLVTGALWAACFWLLIGDQLAGSESTHEFITNYGLDALPTSMWFAAGALVAYLLGSVLVVRSSPVERVTRRARFWIARRAERLVEDREPMKRRHRLLWRSWHKWGWRSSMRPLRMVFAWASDDGVRFEAIDPWAYNEFQKMQSDGLVPVMRSYGGGCGAPNGFDGFYTESSVRSAVSSSGSHADYDLIASLSECFVRELKNEKPAVEVRIQMRFPEVYAEIDRLKVEAELRMSIFWPLSLLIVLLGVVWSPLALVALVAPPFLLRNGFDRTREASDKTWSALIAGEVTSPILDAMASAEDERRDFSQRLRYVPPNDDAA